MGGQIYAHVSIALDGSGPFGRSARHGLVAALRRRIDP
jgi:hypothetical protein